jgi:hypothetical protein
VNEPGDETPGELAVGVGIRAGSGTGAPGGENGVVAAGCSVVGSSQVGVDTGGGGIGAADGGAGGGGAGATGTAGVSG